MPLPRLARLDAPGILHHVMDRRIERKEIFYNDTDSNDFIDRLAVLAEEGARDVYVWVLMPNIFTFFIRQQWYNFYEPSALFFISTSGNQR